MNGQSVKLREGFAWKKEGKERIIEFALILKSEKLY